MKVFAEVPLVGRRGVYGALAPQRVELGSCSGDVWPAKARGIDFLSGSLLKMWPPSALESRPLF